MNSIIASTIFYHNQFFVPIKIDIPKKECIFRIV